MDILKLLKDKKQVIKSLLNISMDDKTVAGLRKVSEDESSNEHKIKVLMQVVANQQVQIQQMSALLIIYSSSPDFDSNIAQVMAKMGRGEEALKVMFDKKMNGS